MKTLYFKKWYCQKNFGFNDVLPCNYEVSKITEKAVAFWHNGETRLELIWIPLSALFVFDTEKENENDIENKNSKCTIEETLKEVKLHLACIRKMTFKEALQDFRDFKENY